VANPLCLNRFKSRMGITVDTYDVDLQETLDSVWALAVKWIGYDPQLQEYTEYFSGAETGGFNLYLGKSPVVTDSVVVYLNYQGFYGQGGNTFTSSDLLVRGQDYAVRVEEGIRSGILYAINQSWPYQYQILPQNLSAERGPCVGCIKVVYEAGLDAAEMKAITNALLTEAAANFRSQATGFGAILNDSMDGASVSVSPFNNQSLYKGRSPFVSPLTAGTLSLYRRIPVSRL